MAQISNLSESLEDYLEIILQLVNDKGEARVKDIAERKAVRMASVTGALKRLSRDGFIDYRARGTVTLTAEGLDLANRVLQRHEFITRFLHEVLGVTHDIAERDACAIEHVISLETLDRLAAFVEFLKECPRVGGNLVERFSECYAVSERGADGEEAEPLPCRSEECVNGFGTDAVRMFSGSVSRTVLSEMQPGERGRVVSVRARSLVRQRLLDMGLLPGVEVEMLKVAPLGDPIEIKLKGYHLSLRRIEASTVGVERV